MAQVSLRSFFGEAVQTRGDADWRQEEVAADDLSLDRWGAAACVSARGSRQPVEVRGDLSGKGGRDHRGRGSEKGKGPRRRAR